MWIVGAINCLIEKIAMEISYSGCHKQLKYRVFIIVVVIQFKRKFPQTFEYDKMMF